MKKNIYQFILYIPLLFVCLGIHSCSDEDPAKWVDLRYKTEDAYVLPASGEESVTIQVKSTDPWSVFGHESWNTITPDHGDAGTIYDVKITCKKNTDLDDRTDTITIKSDYWVGKRFTITQKGIAYLNLENAEISFNKTGNAAAFNVVSNQKWTAKVTEGEKWLSISSGQTGEKNGTVNLKSIVNNGEKRIGEVTIYDRHGVARQMVVCTQDGVVLTPAIPQNGKWFALQPNAQQLEIAVDADIDWTVSKDNVDDEWFNINTASTTRNKLVLNILEHTGRAVRISSVSLTSKAAENTDPVVKQVKFRQINPPYIITKTINKSIGGTYTEENLTYGEYHFFMKPPMKFPGQFQISLRWAGGPEYYVQYNLTNGVAAGLTSPWNGAFNMEESTYHRSIDTNKENSIGIKVEKGSPNFVDPSSGKQITNFTWYINKQKVGDLEGSKGLILQGILWQRILDTPTTLRMYYDGSDGGAIFVEKYEFIPPLDWGQD